MTTAIAEAAWRHLAGFGETTMGYFTLRNTTILALVQIAVVVAGVLASGAAHKYWQQSDRAPPSSIVVVSEYGWLVLLVPLIWITVTVALQSRAEDESVAALIAYLSGICVILVLVVSIGYLVVGPWLRLCCSWD